MSLKSPCKTISSLPSVGNTTGDIRAVLDTGAVYKWNSSNWVDTSTKINTTSIPTSLDQLVAGSTNKFYTTTDFDTDLSGKSTSNLAEGTNLYYTDAKVKAIAKSTTTARVISVSRDAGDDATGDGSPLKPFKTIQAGINAANLIADYMNQVVVEISPPNGGNGYVENITLSQQGVTLKAATESYAVGACLIKGTVTINLTGTSGSNFLAASNEVYMHGLTISKAAGSTLLFSGTTFQRLIITNCYVESTSTGSALIMTNTGVSGSTKSTITSRDTDYNNNNSTTATIQNSAGRIFIAGANPEVQNSNASGPSILLDGASAAGATVSLNNTSVTGQAQVTDNTANLSLAYSSITSGSLAAIVTPSSPSTGIITLASAGLSTTATNSITGSGVVVVAQAAKLSTGGDIISTVTQAVIAGFPQGQTMIGAGATAATNALLVIKNGHLKFQQSTAPTVTVNANAGTGATSTVSNATDTAGKLALMLGTSPASGVQTTVNFNKAFATAPIISLTPANALTAANSVSKQIFVSSATSSFAVNFGVTGTAAEAYSWHYQIIETQ
jgi:hypothetical protein